MCVFVFVFVFVFRGCGRLPQGLRVHLFARISSRFLMYGHHVPPSAELAPALLDHWTVFNLDR